MASSEPREAMSGKTDDGGTAVVAQLVVFAFVVGVAVVVYAAMVGGF